MSQYYQDPIERPPFGLRDHAPIELQPNERVHVKQPTITIKARDFRPSKRQAIGTYLEAVDVCTMIYALKTCKEKVSLLEQIITTGLDHILPIQSRRVDSTEPHWITSRLKELTQARQRALSRGDNQQFREILNRVNCERKACRAKNFQAKVQHLKECKPSAWWNEIKKLTAVSQFPQRDLMSLSPYNICVGLQMTSLLPTSAIRPFSRPCVISHRSLLITSHFSLIAQPNYLHLLFPTSLFIRN